MRQVGHRRDRHDRVVPRSGHPQHAAVADAATRRRLAADPQPRRLGDALGAAERGRVDEQLLPGRQRDRRLVVEARQLLEIAPEADPARDPRDRLAAGRHPQRARRQGHQDGKVATAPAIRIQPHVGLQVACSRNCSRPPTISTAQMHEHDHADRTRDEPRAGQLELLLLGPDQAAALVDEVRLPRRVRRALRVGQALQALPELRRAASARPASARSRRSPPPASRAAPARATCRPPRAAGPGGPPRRRTTRVLKRPRTIRSSSVAARASSSPGPGSPWFVSASATAGGASSGGSGT